MRGKSYYSKGIISFFITVFYITQLTLLNLLIRIFPPEIGSVINSLYLFMPGWRGLGTTWTSGRCPCLLPRLAEGRFFPLLGHMPCLSPTFFRKKPTFSRLSSQWRQRRCPCQAGVPSPEEGAGQCQPCPAVPFLQRGASAEAAVGAQEAPLRGKASGDGR